MKISYNQEQYYLVMGISSLIYGIYAMYKYNHIKKSKK